LSIKVIQWVWDCSQSRNAERLVLLAIADNAADDGSHAYPSVAEICRKANLSERGVQAALARLVKSGELHIHVGGGRGHTNYYTVIMKPCARNTPQNVRPSGSPSKTETPQNSTVNPADPAGNPAGSAPGTVLEPSLEPTTSFADKSSPTAQTILAAFIDWLSLPAQGSVKLSGRAIGIYAKTIKELLGEGFEEGLLKRALAAMHERNLTGRPTLLHSFVVEVQASRPTSGAGSPKPFVQQADEYKAAKEQRSQRRAQLIDDAMEAAQQHGSPMSPPQVIKLVDELIESGQIDLDDPNGLKNGVPTLYSGYQDAITVDVEEVAGP
jgi:hypothetical protein